MCIRIVYNGNDTITGFNFDIDPAVWEHRVIQEKNRFYIGIKMPDGEYHSFHGVNRNGNAGTLLYVHGNQAGFYCGQKDCLTVAALTEQFVKNEITFDDACNIVRSKKIVYAPDATMQAVLSDQGGRTLLVEPGIGYTEEKKRYSLMSNYSLLSPQSTEAFLVPGDDRYQRAQKCLDGFGENFSVSDAFSVLQAVSQDEPWATRVSFVYSAKEQTVYYALNNGFNRIMKHPFIGLH